MSNDKQSFIKKGIIIFILILLISYIAGFIYYQNTFLAHTTLNGLDISHMQVDEVHQQVSKNLQNHQLTLTFIDGEKEIINSNQCGLQYNPHNNINDLYNQQNHWLWFTSFFKGSQLSLVNAITINDEQFNKSIQSLKPLKDQKKPQDAYVTYAHDKFQIIKEDLGSTINLSKFKQIILDSFITQKQNINLYKENAYIAPQITSTNKQLQNYLELANKYCDAQIIYETINGTIKLDQKQLLQWIKKENNQFIYDDQFYKQNATQFIKKLSHNINNIGTTRTYTLANNRKVSVSGGNYGLKLKETAERDALIQDILAHKKGTRKPITSGIQVSTSNKGIGHTYVEIDLTAQVVNLVKNNQLILTTDCVTGKHIDPSRRTPQGTYYLYAKQQNRVLRGSKLPNGKYEYESPVDFWMPFNRGIGLHDASWRKEFGKDIYIKKGSHGCINLPHDAAKTIYFSIKTKTPVICHY